MSDRVWKSVGYTVTAALLPGGPAVAGKACGVRDDECGFYVLYAMPVVYPEGFDWTAMAKERLDTFLNCGCSTVSGVCAVHQLLMDTWAKDDQLRNTVMASEIPDALKEHVKPGDPRAQLVRPA